MKSIVILAVVVATSCSLAGARPAISSGDGIQSAPIDENLKQSPFMQPMFFNDDKGSPKLLARPIGFIPIFMISNPRRAPSQQHLNADMQKTAAPRNLNLDNPTPISDNADIEKGAAPRNLNLDNPTSSSDNIDIQKSAAPRNLNLDNPAPSSDTIQKISMYPSLTETQGSQINTNPTAMEDKEGILPRNTDEPLEASLPAKPMEDLSNKSLLAENDELPNQRSKRQFRPYPHYPYGYHHGYDYDDYSDYADISIDVDVVRDDIMPGYPYFRTHRY